ncbi:MAG: hypothetical protein JXA10_07860 [Anaerolineae bacterium]|nr:hypothetical protein [Anaerolineae bacterium]
MSAPTQEMKGDIMAASSTENPYAVGMAISDPDNFFGRQDILTMLENRIRSAPTSVAIRLHGQRRMGKTSIVRVFQRSRRDIALPVFISMQITAEKIDTVLDRFKNEILDEITYETEAHQLPKTLLPFHARDQISPDEFRQDFIPAVIEALGDRLLLLMFDEFENLAHERYATVRQLLVPLLTDLLDLRIGMIFVIGDPHISLGTDFSSLFRLVNNILVSFFDPEEAKQALLEPAGDALNFQPDGIAKVLDLTYGHPLYLSAFGSKLYENYQHTGTPIDASKVEAQLNNVVQEVEGAFVYQLRDSVSARERQMLYHIMMQAKNYPDHKVPRHDLAKNFGGFNIRAETAWDIIQSLKRREIITNEVRPDGTEWVYFLVEPMRLWVENLGKQPPPDELEAEIKALEPDAVRISTTGATADPLENRLMSMPPLTGSLAAPASETVHKRMVEAEQAQATGNTKAAIALYMQALDYDQYNPRAWLALASLLDDPDERAICLENVLTIDPNNAHALRLTGRAPAIQPEPASDTPPALGAPPVNVPNPFAPAPPPTGFKAVSAKKSEPPTRNFVADARRTDTASESDEANEIDEADAFALLHAPAAAVAAAEAARESAGPFVFEDTDPRFNRTTDTAANVSPRAAENQRQRQSVSRRKTRANLFRARPASTSQQKTSLFADDDDMFGSIDDDLFFDDFLDETPLFASSDDDDLTATKRATKQTKRRNPLRPILDYSPYSHRDDGDTLYLGHILMLVGPALGQALLLLFTARGERQHHQDEIEERLGRYTSEYGSMLADFESSEESYAREETAAQAQEAHFITLDGDPWGGLAHIPDLILLLGLLGVILATHVHLATIAGYSLVSAIILAGLARRWLAFWLLATLYGLLAVFIAINQWPELAAIAVLFPLVVGAGVLLLDVFIDN